jgi:hypothetical protein
VNVLVKQRTYITVPENLDALPVARLPANREVNSRKFMVVIDAMIRELGHCAKQNPGL